MADEEEDDDFSENGDTTSYVSSSGRSSVYSLAVVQKKSSVLSAIVKLFVKSALKTSPEAREHELDDDDQRLARIEEGIEPTKSHDGLHITETSLSSISPSAILEQITAETSSKDAISDQEPDTPLPCNEVTTEPVRTSQTRNGWPTSREDAISEQEPGTPLPGNEVTTEPASRSQTRNGWPAKLTAHLAWSGARKSSLVQSLFKASKKKEVERVSNSTQLETEQSDTAPVHVQKPVSFFRKASLFIAPQKAEVERDSTSTKLETDQCNTAPVKEPVSFFRKASLCIASQSTEVDRVSTSTKHETEQSDTTPVKEPVSFFRKPSLFIPSQNTGIDPDSISTKIEDEQSETAHVKEPVSFFRKASLSIAPQKTEIERDSSPTKLEIEQSYTAPVKEPVSFFRKPSLFIPSQNTDIDCDSNSRPTKHEDEQSETALAKEPVSFFRKVSLFIAPQKTEIKRDSTTTKLEIEQGDTAPVKEPVSFFRRASLFIASQSSDVDRVSTSTKLENEQSDTAPVKEPVSFFRKASLFKAFQKTEEVERVSSSTMLKTEQSDKAPAVKRVSIPDYQTTAAEPRKSNSKIESAAKTTESSVSWNPSKISEQFGTFSAQIGESLACARVSLESGFSARRRSAKFYIAVVCLLVCVFSVIFFISAIASKETYPTPSPDPETSMRQFRSSIQVQKVDNEVAGWSSDLKKLDSPRAQKIIDALAPRIRSAFESQGFSTDAVIITKIGPISVTIYRILNNTVTTLSSPEEISLANSYANDKGRSLPGVPKPRPQGHKLVIRVEFETSGKPSDNADMIRQVGEAETEKIQFMLDKYLENQGVVARSEKLEISPEFRRQAEMAKQVLTTTPPEIEMEINCYRTGKSLSMARVLVGCPPNCNEIPTQMLFGTDWYHIDSMICLAAIHSYVIQKEKGGIVEFLISGESFLYAGSTRNGVKSDSSLKYGKKFIVKKPGPVWTTQQTTTAQPMYNGLQDPSFLFLTGYMTALLLDNTPISFSLSLTYSSKLASEMRTLLQNKLIYSLEDMHFSVDKLLISGFKPDNAASSALRLKYDVYGAYKKNVEALIPFKPWDPNMKNKFKFYLKENLHDEGLLVTGLTVEFDEQFLEKMVSQPTTSFTPSPTPFTLCNCAEVFIIQSAISLSLKAEVINLIEMYKKLFDLTDFDQFRRKIGMAVIVPQQSERGLKARNVVLITDVGDKNSDDIIIELEYEMLTVVESMPSVGGRENEELWEAIRHLKNLRFFTENFNSRNKLLVVNTNSAFGPGSANNVDMFNRVKSDGIKVLYMGYAWQDIEGYPEAYVSEPTQDFIKHVRTIDDSPELASYVVDVMRMYICSDFEGICTHRNFSTRATPQVSEYIELEDSYARGVPEGTGLTPFGTKGGMIYKGKHLSETDSIRRTEPDVDQAYYMMYECGRPGIKPLVPEGKIVGGNESTPHSWPWAISINLLRSRFNSLTNKKIYTYNRWKCGGTIIESSWVVTAAHCFASGEEKKYTTEYKVVTGIHDQNSLSDLNGNVYAIRRIVYHPYYEDAKNKFDIALLQTHPPIKFRREVSPACLPNPDVIPTIGKKCVLAGWGYTSTSGDTARNLLKQAAQFVEDPDICQRAYGRIDYDPNFNLCTKKSYTEISDMQCRGDSGGPLVCLENTKWILYGVSNWGPRECERRGYGGYALVPSMMEWICCYVASHLGPCIYTTCNRRLS